MAHRGSSGPRFFTCCCESQSRAFVVSTQCWRFSRTESLRAGVVSRLKSPAYVVIILSIEFL